MADLGALSMTLAAVLAVGGVVFYLLSLGGFFS